MNDIRRILDANGNRAREALRVMEEAARFLLDDAALSEAIKSLRHELAASFEAIGDVTRWRETASDVGTRITHAREGERASAAAVVVAAGKRLSEALRAIEEYGKTIDGAFAAKIEQLRYRGYEIEQRLNRAMGAGWAAGGGQWRVCVLISESLCAGGDWQRVARACIEAGADAIQLREKAIEGGELLKRARSLVAMAKGTSTRVIINDRPGIAVLAGAHGVHLGQGDLPAEEARKIVGSQRLIGVSTSCVEQARRALAAGADYCGVGPMFATTTKHKPVIVGPEYLREYLKWNRLPHLAIGGITLENANTLLSAGARGVAVSSCVCGADEPGQVVRRLMGKMSERGSGGVSE